MWRRSRRGGESTRRDHSRRASEKAQGCAPASSISRRPKSASLMSLTLYCGVQEKKSVEGREGVEYIDRRMRCVWRRLLANQHQQRRRARDAAAAAAIASRALAPACGISSWTRRDLCSGTQGSQRTRPRWHDEVGLDEAPAAGQARAGWGCLLLVSGCCCCSACTHACLLPFPLAAWNPPDRCCEKALKQPQHALTSRPLAPFSLVRLTAIVRARANGRLCDQVEKGDEDLKILVGVQARMENVLLVCLEEEQWDPGRELLKAEREERAQ